MCDVSDEKARRTSDTYPKDHWSETKKGLSCCLESALLGCLVWWSRRPLVENKLSDINCDSGERHCDSSLAEERKERDGGSARAGVFIARQKRFSNHVKASEGTLPMEEAGVAVEVASAADTGDTG